MEGKVEFMVRSAKVWIALLPLVLVGALGACSEEKVTHIGAVLPLSGPWSLYGEPIRKGIELAHEQLNDQYESGEFPHRMELTVLDSESEEAKAAEQLQTLIDEHNVLGVIGGVTSAEALAMIDIADQEERVLLSPSASSPDLTEKGTRYFYRIYPSDFNEGTRLASWAALNLDLENIVVVTVNTPFARGISRVFQDEFERYDGNVLEEIVYSEGELDAQAVAADVLDQEETPQAVYIADFAEQVLAIIQALRDEGFEGRIFTTSAFAAPEILVEGGEDVEGVTLAQTVFDADSEEPKVAAFVEAYREKYQETPGLFAAHGYDAMMIMAQASLEPIGIPSEFWKGFKGLGEYEGVTGIIQFDQSGDVGKFPRVYTVRDGKLVDFDQILEERKQAIQERRQQLFQQLERLRRQQREATGGDG